MSNIFAAGDVVRSTLTGTTVSVGKLGVIIRTENVKGDEPRVRVAWIDGNVITVREPVVRILVPTTETVPANIIARLPVEDAAYDEIRRASVDVTRR